MPKFAVVRSGKFIETRMMPGYPPIDQIKHENGLPQLRQYVEVKPEFDGAAEKLTGPEYTVSDDRVTATWTKVALSAQEIDDRKDAHVNLIDHAQSEALFAIVNEIRGIKNQAALTRAQFRNWVKGLL